VQINLNEKEHAKSKSADGRDVRIRTLYPDDLQNLMAKDTSLIKMLWRQRLCHILISHERSFILVFRHEEWLVGDDPFYLKFWAILTPFLQKRRFAKKISLVAPQAW